MLGVTVKTRYRAVVQTADLGLEFVHRGHELSH